MTAVVGSAVGAVSGALLAFEEGTRRLCDLDGAAGDAARRYRRVTRGAGRLEDPEAARLRRKMEEMQKEQAVRIAKVDLQAFVESRPQWLELLEEFKSNQMEVRRQLVVHESSQGTRQMEP